MSFNTIIKISLLSACLLIALLFSCRKEKPEMNAAADPCACASEVTADFVIEENTGPISGLWIETDTTFHNKNVRFRALEGDAEYTWYIGLDIETDQASWKYFSDQWIGSDIPITLVVKKDPNKTCFPDDDGYDSITKTFHVSQYPIFHGYDEDIEFGTIEGTYRVFSEELGDSIDITFDADQHEEAYSLNISNIDGSGINCPKKNWRRIVYYSYRELSFTMSGTFVASNICEGLNGVIKNPINGVAEIHIETGQYEDDGTIKEKTFHYFGRKLNN